MKLLFVLLLFICTIGRSQSPLSFDKRYVECEDKWVAFTINEDSSYNYGFIYIDETAGLTIDFEGRFKIVDGRFIPKKVNRDSASYKYRLKPNDIKVAIIPKERFAELEVEEVPQWLQAYKVDTNSIKHLHRWGYYYNAWGECAKALTYLLRAQSINPDYEGLAFELAFSYNCLKQYQKAIPVVEWALKLNPTDCYLHKELCYALAHLDDPDKAAETCKKSISACNSDFFKSEMAYGVTRMFYNRKNKENFKQWAAETKKWAEKDSQVLKWVDNMETDLGQ